MLVYGLKQNTSSLYFAKINNWKYPVSQEWLILADFVDTFIMANNGSKRKPKQYPRPFKTDTETKQLGTKISIDKAREIYKIKRRTPEEQAAVEADRGNKSNG